MFYVRKEPVEGKELRMPKVKRLMAGPAYVTQHTQWDWPSIGPEAVLSGSTVLGKKRESYGCVCFLFRHKMNRAENGSVGSGEVLQI